MEKDIIILRHGATPGNERGAFIGCGTDESLSEKGRKLAQEFAFPGDFDTENMKCFAGPLKRTVETLEVIKSGANDSTTGTNNATSAANANGCYCDAVIIDELREIDFGKLEGKSHKELDGDPDYQAWIDRGGEGLIPGGESKEAFIERSGLGFEEVLENMGDCPNALVVCHGGSIMAIMSSLCDGDYYDYRCGNLKGYRIKLDYTDGKISVITYNCISAWGDA